MAPLANTKIIIVGGTAGIGLGVAQAVHAEGAHVVVASSKPARVAAAVKTLGPGPRVQGEVLDASDEAAIKALFEKVGKFDHLVWTAGDAFVPGYPEGDLAAVRKGADVRYWSFLAAVQHARPFLASTGSVTVTSGVVALRPLSGWTLAAGGSGALIAATRNLALDLAPVRVNCITPGAVVTPLWDGLPEAARAGLFAQVAAKNPVGHIGTSAELAEAYLFALKCTYLTGQSIVVDGGATLV